MAGNLEFGWVARRWKLLLFITALIVFVCLPNPESIIVRVVELAGLVLVLGRGLVAYYNDFVDLLKQPQRRR